MNTISRPCMPRHFRRLTNALFGLLALSSTTLACAVPTESEQTASAEATGAQSEALANNGGGTGGDGSTCASRLQSCQNKCCRLYGGDIESNRNHNPFTLQSCLDLCDEIHAECSTPGGPGGGGIAAFR